MESYSLRNLLKYLHKHFKRKNPENEITFSISSLTPLDKQIYIFICSPHIGHVPHHTQWILFYNLPNKENTPPNLDLLNFYFSKIIFHMFDQLTIKHISI